MIIDNVGIEYSPLQDSIVLARFGKDRRCALETRDATSELLKAIVSYAFNGSMPEPGDAVEVSFGSNNEQFTLKVARRST